MANRILERDGKLAALLEALDGRRVVLDGISGIIRYQPMRVTHEPDDAGRDNPEYDWIRRSVGDDWITDLTHSPSVLARICAELGIDFPF